VANEEQAAWVERVLGIRLDALPTLDELDDPEVDPTAEKAELQELGLEVADLWQGAVQSFRAASDEVNKQIQQLQAALRETDDPDLHDIAEFGLNALTGNTRVPLMAAITEAGTGSPEQLRAAAPKLLKAVGAFRARLASPEVRACDSNPFGVDMAIEQTFTGALDQLAYAARLAA
jgi:hypothetical protein